MRLVYLYGPPAVGKLTVARELSALTGFKLMHNHLTVNLVKSLFPFNSDPYLRLVRQFRNAMLAEAARVGVDLIMTGAIPKWAIFAPVFVPLMMRLHVDPAAVLAAYRVGDSPINAISPLNAYFALIVTFATRYQKHAGVGTVVALMLPYVVIVFAVWILLLAAWQLLGLPWGF